MSWSPLKETYDPEHLRGWTVGAKLAQKHCPGWLKRAAAADTGVSGPAEGRGYSSSFLRGGSQKPHCWLFMFGCCWRTHRMILKPQVTPTTCLLQWRFQSQPPCCPTCPVLGQSKLPTKRHGRNALALQRGFPSDQAGVCQELRRGGWQDTSAGGVFGGRIHVPHTP